MGGSGLQPAVLAVNFLFPAFAFCIVVVRFWRKIDGRNVAGDDIVLGCAMIISIAYCWISYVYTKEAYYGYDEADVPYDKIDMVKVTKLQYVRSVIYNPILCLVKASFLWTLMKLKSPRVWLNRCLWAIQIINAGYMIGSTFASIFACIPVERNFNRKIDGTCYNASAYVIASVSIVIITDLLVLAMPTWMIYDLHMPRLRKIVTIAFLSLGLAVTAIGAVRLHYLVELFVYHKNPNRSLQDTYSAIECNLAIIGACGPTIKWIMGHCVPFLDSTRITKPSSYVPNSRTFSRNPRSRGYVDTINSSMHHDDFMYTTSGGNRADDQGVMELQAGMGRNNASVDDDGIVKTVEWNVSSEDRTRNAGRSDDGSEKRLVVKQTRMS